MESETSPTTKTTPLIEPQKYEWAPTGDIDRYVESTKWVMEQKLDGMRLMAHVTPEGVTFSGAARNAAVMLHLDTIRQQLAPIVASGNVECVLDGEIMTDTGEWWLFDLPYLKGLIQPSEPLWLRRAALECLGAQVGLNVVRQARQGPAKRALWARVLGAGEEGVVVKHIDGSYVSGGRNKAVLKVKITHTVDCVVVDRDRGAKNAVLGVWRDGELIEVGSCSMIGKPDAQPGDVIEVEYQCIRDLDSPALTMPRMVRLRSDKLGTECGFEQLVPTLAGRRVLS